MTHRRHVPPTGYLAAILLAALACAGPARPETATRPAGMAPATIQAPAGASLADTLPFDPTVRAGVLPNGLRYFIRHNHKPENRVSLRLAVAAGSNLEADDQRGFAHFCEHMDFNGSTHFKADEMIAYLQSIGMRWALDANAYTSFDETVYMLEVPTDRDTLLDRGLLALSDFAGGATLSDQEIDKERGVIMEEWRLGRGANERMWRKQVPVLYHGSRYADRLPIGQPEIIQQGPASRLRDFYRAWYTPDRMAVIAVGDVDPARMDSLIRVHFVGLAKPAHPSTRQTPDITLISIATDQEATGSSVRISYKRPHREERTVADFRRDLIEQLYGSMLNARFGEIAHRAAPPFLGAYAYAQPLGRTVDAWSLSATVADGGIATGLAALLEEATRVREHGFLASELVRAREQRRSWNESAYAERDKSESSAFAGRYVQAYLTGGPVPGIEAEYALNSALLEGITLDEVNALTPRLIHDEGRVVLANAPEKSGVTAPTEAELRAVLARSTSIPATAWEDRTAGRVLMANPPKPGTIRSKRIVDALGVTVITLSNGVEVWLKPTDFKADEIQIGAWARGGTSVVDSTRYQTAALSSQIVNDGGVGGFTSTDLQKMLAGKLVYVGPYASAYTHGLMGQARPADLETALQLAYLDFTSPTEDPAGFAALRQRLRARLADRANSPEQAYVDTLAMVNSGGFYMNRPLTVDGLEAVKLGDALDLYRKRYANAADFTFYLVGSFQVDSVAPLIARYLGALPSTGKRTSQWVDVGPRYPRGVRTVQVHKGVEPKGRVTITFFTNGGLEELDLHRGRASGSILMDHLRQSLRELLGGTYSQSAVLTYLTPVPGYQTMTIAFGCDPARADTLVSVTLAEVRKLRDEGPSLADVQKEQETERREVEVGMKQNGFWLGGLQVAHQLGWDPLRLLKRLERIDLLTPENIRMTFAKYTPLDRYTVVTLLPETDAVPKAGGR